MRRARRSDFQERKRWLYALVFDEERAVYIGQSMNPERRFSQHRAPSGGWHRSRGMRLVILEEIEGTYEQAEVREYVWRWIAHLRGWAVYVLPPNTQVRLGRRMGLFRRIEAWRTMFTQGWPVRQQFS